MKKSPNQMMIYSSLLEYEGETVELENTPDYIRHIYELNDNLAVMMNEHNDDSPTELFDTTFDYLVAWFTQVALDWWKKELRFEAFLTPSEDYIIHIKFY